MNKAQLLTTALQIAPVDISVADEYEAKRETMVAEVNRIMVERPDLDELIGSGNREMMENNHANHARFVESILRAFDPEILVDTVLWVFRAYRSHGFRLAYWPAQLNAWVKVLKQNLEPATFEVVYPLYNWFIIRQPAFVEISDEQLDEPPSGSTPFHGE